MKAVIYCRESEDRTGEEAGVTRQREDAEKLAELRGWTVVRTIVENDLSAAGKKKRPGFDAMIKMIEADEIGAVIGWNWYRVERNRRDGNRLLEAGQKHNIVIALVRGSDIDLGTPAGRLVADMLSSVSRHEIDEKSDRQKRAAQQRAQRGEPNAGRRAFGYEQDGLTLRPAEADAVRWAYDAHLAGVPLGEIAREWNRRGFASQQRPWVWDNIRAVLKNPRYAGLRRYDGEIIGKAVWPAVVSEETFYAVQDVLDGRAARTVPRGAQRLLTAIALCGAHDGPVEDPEWTCGSTVHAGGHVRKIPMYRCSDPQGEGPHVSRQALPVEDWVGLVICKRLARPDAGELLETGDRTDVAELRADAAALRRRRENLAVMLGDGDLSPAQFRTAAGRVDAKLAAVEAELADAGRVDVLGPLVRADDPSAVWDGLSVARKRLVVDTLMTVRLLPPGRGVRTFRPETVAITWK